MKETETRGRTLAPPPLLGVKAETWPDGTPMNKNVCKSERQLMSEIHAMLSELTDFSKSKAFLQ